MFYDKSGHHIEVDVDTRSGIVFISGNDYTPVLITKEQAKEIHAMLQKVIDS